MKCRMFALSLALGALLCLAPSAAALKPQPEAPAPDTAEPAGQALTEEVTKEVTETVEVPILPEKPPIQISYTTPEEIGFAWEEDGLELEVAEVLPVEEISLAPDPDADASAPEAPADSDDTNGTEAAAASDAPAQAPHTEAPAAAQPAAPAVPDVQSKAFLSPECSASLRAIPPNRRTRVHNAGCGGFLFSSAQKQKREPGKAPASACLG